MDKCQCHPSPFSCTTGESARPSSSASCPNVKVLAAWHAAAKNPTSREEQRLRGDTQPGRQSRAALISAVSDLRRDKRRLQHASVRTGSGGEAVRRKIRELQKMELFLAA